MQMYENGAIDIDDARHITKIVFERLRMYCAPVQDDAVTHAKDVLLEENDPARHLAVLLELSSLICDDIEALVEKMLSDE